LRVSLPIHKENSTSDRRQFFKDAGILGIASWWNGLAAEHRIADETRSSDNLSFPGNVSSPVEAGAIVLENAEMRLAISSSGSALSLIHKPSGQECLAQDTGEPMFEVTQYRPYDNELQLAYPAKITHFRADQVRREDNRLIVSFQSVGYEAAIEFKITDAYIAFRLESLTYNGYTKLRPKGKTPIEFARITAKGVEFVLNADSPVRALEELKQTLEMNRDGLPAWVADLRAQVDDIGRRFIDEIDAIKQRLDAMGSRVHEALKRIEKKTYGVCELTSKTIPKARLEAIPWTRFTVDAQAQLEKDGALKSRRIGQLGTVDGGNVGEVERDEDEEPEEAKAAKEKE